MQSLPQHNDGVKYLLTCIDTFSKYAWVRSLKTKSGLCVKEAFEPILEEKVPLYKAFLNSVPLSVCKSLSTCRPIKAPSSEMPCFKVN